MSSTATHHHHTRPLDAMAAAIVVMLCLSWGFNQVATKLAIHDIPPLIQGAIRSSDRGAAGRRLVQTARRSVASRATARSLPVSSPARCSAPSSS